MDLYIDSSVYAEHMQWCKFYWSEAKLFLYAPVDESSFFESS